MPAARTLLERAVVLLPAGADRAEALVELGGALTATGELGRAGAVLADAFEGAASCGDERLRARVAIEQSSLRAMTDPGVASADLVALADESIAVFERAGDDLGLAKAWIHLAEIYWLRGNCSEMEHVLERALVHAERAGAERELRWVLRALTRAAMLGPRPVPDAIARCTALRKRAQDDAALAAHADSMLAVLEAMQGNQDDARRLYERSATKLQEVGLKRLLGSMQMYGGMAELISGDGPAAERELRSGYDLLTEIGEKAVLSTMAAYLAGALALQGRFDEADWLTVVSEESTSPDDLASQALWRGTRARVLANRGEFDRAEQLAREAVALSRQTDLLTVQADAFGDLADVLGASGRPEEAAAALADAVELCETKGNIVGAAHARMRLSELATAPPA